MNQRGVTIIESLAAIGILAVVTVGFMGWAKMAFGGVSNIKENTEITNSMAKLQSAFGSDEIYCTKMLGGRTLNTPIANIRYYNSRTDQLSADPIIQSGSTIEPTSSAIVSEIQIRPVADLGPAFPGSAQPTIVVANLEIGFQKLNGPALAVRKIPMYIHLQGGQVLRCSTTSPSSITVNNQICSIKNDGHAYYDPSQTNPRMGGNCLDTPDVMWTQGSTPFEAKCNPGYRVAITDEHMSAEENIVCYAEMDNFIPLPPRTYVSGYVDDEAAAAVRKELDLATSTCKFTYATGAATSGYRSFIKCVRE